MLLYRDIADNILKIFGLSGNLQKVQGDSITEPRNLGTVTTTQTISALFNATASSGRPAIITVRATLSSANVIFNIIDLDASVPQTFVFALTCGSTQRAVSFQRNGATTNVIALGGAGTMTNRNLTANGTDVYTAFWDGANLMISVGADYKNT